MSEEIKERVMEITTRNFSITKCPERVFQDFVAFAKKETNDNYSMALKMLLDAKEANIKEVILFEQYMELKQEIASLRASIEDTPEEEEPKRQAPKTFGSA